MFGLLISGRPINANPTTISQTQYAFTIPSTPAFNHIALFLLPGSSLPPDVGATVWIQIPPSGEFKLLGALAERKQSAIFQIGGGGVNGNSGVPAGVDQEGDEMLDEDAMGDQIGGASGAGGGGGGGADTITIGISIEPAQNVEAQLAALKSEQVRTQQVGSGGGNLTASAGTASSSGALVRTHGMGSSPTPSPVSTKVLAQRIIGNAFNFLASFGADTVPLKAFQDWWVKFEKKVDLDPTFLERAEQG